MDPATARGLLLSALLSLIISLSVKVLGVPERWLSKGGYDLSYSPFHSHAIWHCGVWLSEVMYLWIYVNALEAR